MSSKKATPRNNHIAGAVMLLIALVSCAGLGYLNWLRNHPVDIVSYEIHFDLTNGVEGLQTGSQVLYGGITVGKVRQVTYREKRLVVAAEVAKQFALHPGAEIYRSGSMIGGGATLVMASMGRRDEPILPDGAVIMASTASDEGDRIVGGRNINRIQQINERVREVLVRIGGMSEQMQDLRDTGEGIAALRGDVTGDTEDWIPVVTSIEGHVASIREGADTIGLRMDGLRDSAVDVSGRYETLVTGFDPPGSERPLRGIRELFEDFRSLSIDFEALVVARARRIVDDARVAIERSEAASRLFASNRDSIRSTLDRFIADSALASQQLALTESEVIGSLGLPLLERPDAATREAMARAEAMSDWARTAEQLDLLLDAVETITVEGADDPEARATLDDLTETLRKALADYESAGSGLFETRPPAPRPTDE